MALITAPLLSFDARGAIGKSIVFSGWKGRKTARQYVIPANPNTAAQQITRSTFQWVHDAYKNLGADAKAPWILKAAQMKITAPNAFQSVNMPLLRTSTDAHEIQYMCEVNSGINAGAPALTPGSGTLAAVLTAPSLPLGWTIVQAIFCCLLHRDPHGEDEAMPLLTAVKTSTPWSHTFSGLTSGQMHIVGGCFQFDRGGGASAYGVSVNATGTPS